jgi:hypothetical protein
MIKIAVEGTIWIQYEAGSEFSTVIIAAAGHTWRPLTILFVIRDLTQRDRLSDKPRERSLAETVPDVEFHRSSIMHSRSSSGASGR